MATSHPQSEPARQPEPAWREAFRKILALEQHKGFADNAVGGGLRRFIERWDGELREYLGDPEIIAALVDRPYRQLDPAQRREWVAGWTAALEGRPVARPIPPAPGTPAQHDRPGTPASPNTPAPRDAPEPLNRADTQSAGDLPGGSPAGDGSDSIPAGNAGALSPERLPAAGPVGTTR